MRKLYIFFLISVFCVSCSAEVPISREALVNCLIENLSDGEIERIAYLESLDDPRAKIRDLELHLERIAKEHCWPNDQGKLADHIKEVVNQIRLHSMSKVLEESNELLKKTFDSQIMSEQVALDCSSSLGDVVASFNSELNEHYVIKVTDEYSKLRVSGGKTVTGSKIGLIMMQLSFIYGFEYYVTPAKEVILVPLRGGLFL